MLYNFSKTISYVFHPLFIPIYGLFLLFNTGLYISFALNEVAKTIIYLVVLFNTILIPGVIIFFFYRKGFLSDFMAEDRKQRHLLYLTMLVFYYSTYLLFDRFSVPVVLSAFVFGATISILTLLIANFFIKISAHMVGVGGLLGALYGVSDFFLESYSVFLIPVILLSGIVAYSRLKLKAHPPKEIYLGLLIGFLCEYLTVYIELL